MQTGKEVKKNIPWMEKTCHNWRCPGLRTECFWKIFALHAGLDCNNFFGTSYFTDNIFFEQETSKNERLNEQDAYLLYYRLNWPWKYL